MKIIKIENKIFGSKGIISNSKKKTKKNIYTMIKDNLKNKKNCTHKANTQSKNLSYIFHIFL